MRRIDAAEKPLFAAGLAIPFLLGFLVKGTLTGAFLTLVWGGLVRVFFLHHATFSINSICHFFGRRRFPTPDRSTKRGLVIGGYLRGVLAQQPPRVPNVRVPRPSPPRARPRGLFISALERVGLAWQVVRMSPERQCQKAAPGVA